jgi:hypothetical protein
MRNCTPRSDGTLVRSRRSDSSPARDDIDRKFVVNLNRRHDSSGACPESLRPRRSLVSGKHRVDAFPITLVLSSRSASAKHGSNLAKAERHACRHAAPFNRNFSETKSTNMETARAICLRFGKAAYTLAASCRYSPSTLSRRPASISATHSG